MKRGLREISDGRVASIRAHLVTQGRWREGIDSIPTVLDGEAKLYWREGDSYLIWCLTGEVFCISRAFWEAEREH